MSEQTIYKVGGAGCGACILKIKKIVESVEGVLVAKFDLKDNVLTVTGKHSPNEVMAAMASGKFTAELMPV